MELRGNHLIAFVSIFFPATMTVTFTLAVYADHVYPIFPFMSYTGDLPIESCIFSLGLNVIAVSYVVIMHIRHNQVIKFCEEENPTHVNTILRLNRKARPWGIVSSFSLGVTGSFQEVNAQTIHRLGALFCTYSAFVYFWYQTIISDLLVEKLNSNTVSIIRTGLSIASTCIHVVAPVLVAILDLTYPKHHLETLVWSIDQEGWRLHVCCSFLEWTIFIINVTYIASYHEEYKVILIKKDEIVYERARRQRQEQATGTSGVKKRKVS